MEQGFIDILQIMIKEQGKNVIFDISKCKAFLADYTKGEYKKESRLLLQTIDAKVPKAICDSNDLDICKKQQIRLLHEDYDLILSAAADIIDTLAFVLRGDTSKTAVHDSHEEKK